MYHKDFLKNKIQLDAHMAACMSAEMMKNSLKDIDKNIASLKRKSGHTYESEIVRLMGIKELFINSYESCYGKKP